MHQGDIIAIKNEMSTNWEEKLGQYISKEIVKNSMIPKAIPNKAAFFDNSAFVMLPLS